MAGEPLAEGTHIATTSDTIARRRAFETDRKDAWWLYPTSVFIGLAILFAYATWAAFAGGNFVTHGVPHYLSPFYSPCLVDSCGAFAIPVVSDLLPAVGFSPAILILWAPLGLRATCYYYRKAYYRAFFADPPNCGVSEPRAAYKGETAFPFILQNLHRYFLYASVIVIAFLWVDTIHAFNWATGTQHAFDFSNFSFGVGVGSLVLLANVILLTGFTFGCHAFRHLIGGGKDCFSCHPVRKKGWEFSTFFNKHHMKWAWLSLFSVCFADLYVRLVASGTIPVLRLI